MNKYLKRSKKLYLASPLGFSEAGRDFMYSKLIPLIEKAGYEILDPWKLTTQDLIKPIMNMPYGKERRKALQKMNFIIGKNNELAIVKSDGLVAILDGSDVDSGTASEIGYAVALHKPILGYRGDFRLSRDNEGSIVNLQVEYFTKKNKGMIVTSIEDFEKELKNVFG